MTTGNDELGALGYVSSAPDFSIEPEETVKPEDLDNLTTLDNVRRLLTDRRKYYQSVDSLDLADKTFTVEQQLLNNKRMVFHLQEIEGLIDGTVKKAKEILKYGRQ